MTNYGVKLVWAGWADDDVIGFSERACSRWKDSLLPGTCMLIYETTGRAPGSKAKGTKSIVGEVEVTGSFEDGEAYRAPTEAHARLLPVRVIVRREDRSPLPLDRVRELLSDPQWPRRGQSWTPLSDEQYQTVHAAWE